MSSRFVPSEDWTRRTCRREQERERSAKLSCVVVVLTNVLDIWIKLKYYLSTVRRMTCVRELICKVENKRPNESMLCCRVRERERRRVTDTNTTHTQWMSQLIESQWKMSIGFAILFSKNVFLEKEYCGRKKRFPFLLFIRPGADSS